MPSRLIPRLARTAILLLTCLSAFTLGITAASAGDGKNGGGSTTTTAGSDPAKLYSKVTYTHRGTSTGDGSQPITSSNANWSPPVCWYEGFTPAEFEAELQRRYDDAGNSHQGTVYDYYWQIRSQMEAIHYHQGDPGSWWVLTYNPSFKDDFTAVCPYDDGWLWAGPNDPPPPAPVTPEMLARAAYKETRLPTRKVALSPAAGNQKVNLATYVKFADAIPLVSVTASLAGVSATVVAVPDSLHVDAGTSYASPTSCDYKFAPSGAGYVVDSSDAGCNVTYRKATAAGSTYTFQAQITWRVSWTPTAEPQLAGGTRLDDGYSTSPQAVTVEEIEAVNR